MIARTLAGQRIIVAAAVYAGTVERAGARTAFERSLAPEPGNDGAAKGLEAPDR